MSWSFGSAGVMNAAANTNVTPLSVAYPAGIAAGDILLLACEAANASVTITPGDITTSLFSRTTNGTTQLFAKIADGTETGNVSISTNNAGWLNAQIARFTGGPSTLTGIVHASASTGSSAATGLAYAAATITVDNTLVIILGGKKVNVTGYTPPAEVPNEIGDGNGSTQNSMTWDYLIQTTATNIAGGSWTITGDSSAARSSITVALLAGATFVCNPLSGRGGGAARPIG